MKIREKRGNDNIRYNRPLKSRLSKIFLPLTFFLAILLLPIASAVEVSVDSDFSQGETLLAVISGNFIDQIRDENIFFYRGHVKIPVIYDVVKINEDFYIYALLTGKNQGNYSLSIEGVRYYKATEIVDDALVFNFSISNETAMFSVNPGVLITNNGFSVELQNLQDRRINIAINENSPFIDSQNSLELKSGEKKRIFFNVIEIPEKILEEVEFSSENFSYFLPVFLDTNKTLAEKMEIGFEFQPSLVEVSMATDSDSKRILYLTNTGEETVRNIFFDISPLLEPYVVISPEKIDKLNPGSIEKIEIQIVSGKEEAVIEGEIIAFTENFSSSFTLVIDFIKDFIATEEEARGESIILTACAQLNGTICTENLECNGKTERAKDGVCCLQPATCEEPRKSSTGKIIGWGLLILVLVFLFWFYKRRYKKVTRKKAL